MTPPDRLTMSQEDRLAYLRASRTASPEPIPAPLLRLLQAGSLEQRCPDCDRVQAAARYCSGCHLPTGPDDWTRSGREGEEADDGS